MQLHRPRARRRRELLLGLNLRIPPYFDYLIGAFSQGVAGRCVHLGYWEAPPGQGEPVPADFWTARPFADAQRRLDERILALGDFADGQQVLDAGCGFGGTLEALNARHASLRLQGVNVDPRQLALCRGIAPRDGNSLAWTEADACELPFAEASFDRVLCIEAMFHFSSRRKFFQEAARALRPGGVFVGTDMVLAPSARDFDTPHFPIFRTLDEGYGPWPDLWGEDADHAALGKAAGLRCTVLEDISAQVRPSHRFTAPEGADVRWALGHADANAALRAALMLKWLHDEGHLRYLRFRFDKPQVKG